MKYVCACVCVCVCVDWIRLTEKELVAGLSVYVVVNRTISYNVWILLAVSGIFSFTRTTVLHGSTYLRCWYSKYKSKNKALRSSPSRTNTYIKLAADGLADLTCTKVSRTSRSYINLLRGNTFICQCQWETNSHREAQVLLELKLFLLSVNVTCMSRNHVRCWGSSIHIRGAIKNYLEKAMDSRSKKKTIKSIHVLSPWEQQTLLSFHQAHAA